LRSRVGSSGQLTCLNTLQNVAIKYRWAEHHNDRPPQLAAELVQVIVAGGCPPSALAAKTATSTIPIVFEVAIDPIKGWTRRQPEQTERQHHGRCQFECRGGAKVAGVNSLIDANRCDNCRPAQSDQRGSFPNSSPAS